jgi:hypothetical protein
MTDNTGESIIACCGLVCSECGAYIKQKCPGCHSDKPMFRNCPVKKCVIERSYVTCADCTEYTDLKLCKKLNSFVSKIFGWIFKSDRIGNCNKIRANGMEEFKAGIKPIKS